jgi:hypothetical protein
MNCVTLTTERGRTGRRTYGKRFVKAWVAVVVVLLCAYARESKARHTPANDTDPDYTSNNYGLNHGVIARESHSNQNNNDGDADWFTETEQDNNNNNNNNVHTSNSEDDEDDFYTKALASFGSTELAPFNSGGKRTASNVNNLVIDIDGDDSVLDEQTGYHSEGSDYEDEFISIIHTVDGYLHAVNLKNTNHNNADILWKLDTGGPLISSHHCIEDRPYSLIPEISSGTILVHNRDGIKRSHMSTKMLVDKAPFISERDGLFFVGHKNSRIFGIDVATGELISDTGSLKDVLSSANPFHVPTNTNSNNANANANVNANAKAKAGLNGDSNPHEDDVTSDTDTDTDPQSNFSTTSDTADSALSQYTQQTFNRNQQSIHKQRNKRSNQHSKSTTSLWFGRIDYVLRAFDAESGMESFNLSYAEILPLSLKQSKLGYNGGNSGNGGFAQARLAMIKQMSASSTNTQTTTATTTGTHVSKQTSPHVGQHTQRMTPKLPMLSTPDGDLFTALPGSDQYTRVSLGSAAVSGFTFPLHTHTDTNADPHTDVLGTDDSVSSVDGVSVSVDAETDMNEWMQSSRVSSILIPSRLIPFLALPEPSVRNTTDASIDTHTDTPTDTPTDAPTGDHTDKEHPLTVTVTVTDTHTLNPTNSTAIRNLATHSVIVKSHDNHDGMLGGGLYAVEIKDLSAQALTHNAFANALNAQLQLGLDVSVSAHTRDANTHTDDMYTHSSHRSPHRRTRNGNGNSKQTKVKRMLMMTAHKTLRRKDSVHTHMGGTHTYIGGPRSGRHTRRNNNINNNSKFVGPVRPPPSIRGADDDAYGEADVHTHTDTDTDTDADTPTPTTSVLCVPTEEESVHLHLPVCADTHQSKLLHRLRLDYEHKLQALVATDDTNKHTSTHTAAGTQSGTHTDTHNGFSGVTDLDKWGYTIIYPSFLTDDYSVVNTQQQQLPTSTQEDKNVTLTITPTTVRTNTHTSSDDWKVALVDSMLHLVNTPAGIVAVVCVLLAIIGTVSGVAIMIVRGLNARKDSLTLPTSTHTAATNNLMLHGKDQETDTLDPLTNIQALVPPTTTPTPPPAPVAEPQMQISLSPDILGYGSHGTMVFKGWLNGRPVAVKRMLTHFHKSVDRYVCVCVCVCMCVCVVCGVGNRRYFAFLGWQLVTLYFCNQLM